MISYNRSYMRVSRLLNHSVGQPRRYVNRSSCNYLPFCLSLYAYPVEKVESNEPKWVTRWESKLKIRRLTQTLDFPIKVYDENKSRLWRREKQFCVNWERKTSGEQNENLSMKACMTLSFEAIRLWCDEISNCVEWYLLFFIQY